MQCVIACSISGPGPLMLQAIKSLLKNGVWPCETAIYLTSYGTTRGNGLQFHPIASVDRMNLLVIFQLKYYACCYGQLDSCFPVYRICHRFLRSRSVSKHYLASQLHTEYFCFQEVGRENFDESLPIHQICEDFLPPKLYGTLFATHYTSFQILVIF